MKHLRSQGRKLQHFIIRDFLELLRVFDFARVGGINTLHVCVNLAKVGVHGSRDCNGACVRTAPAKRRNIVVAVESLKARDDNNTVLSIARCMRSVSIRLIRAFVCAEVV